MRTMQWLTMLFLHDGKPVCSWHTRAWNYCSLLFSLRRSEVVEMIDHIKVFLKYNTKVIKIIAFTIVFIAFET